jgi:hypothetical protein
MLVFILIECVVQISKVSDMLKNCSFKDGNNRILHKLVETILKTDLLSLV